MENTKKGSFCGSVLLSEDAWDRAQLIEDLQLDWYIEIPKEDVKEAEDEKDVDALITTINGHRVVITKFPFPVPNEEAEQCAQNNYLWRTAVEVTRTHKAHIVVAVLGDGDVKDKGVLYAKIMAACCRQKRAIGVFTSGVVFEPNYYRQSAYLMQDEMLPIYNWIWFGLYRTERGISAYTYGMEVFGSHEIEITDVDDEPEYLVGFVASIVSYVLEYDVELKDGETIGLSEDDKRRITVSKGVALPDQETIKIEYKAKAR